MDARSRKSVNDTFINLHKWKPNRLGIQLNVRTLSLVKIIMPN